MRGGALSGHRLLSIAVLMPQALVAAVLALAGFQKVRRGRARVRAEIAGYGLDFVADIGALVVPYVEMGVAAGLMAGIPGAPWMASGVLVVFTGVVAYALATGRDADCGCFQIGKRRTRISAGILARNLVLAGLLLASAAFAPNHGVADRVWALAALAAVAIVGVLVAQTVTLWRAPGPPKNNVGSEPAR